MIEGIFLYIDPSTGSMLFAILIGIFGAAVYMVKSWFVKLKFRLTSGKSVEMTDDKIPFVIFADDKRYYTVFKPVLEELDRRGIDTVYMTASPDDPVLDNPFSHIKAEFIGEGNKAFARLNFLKAGLVLATTPGLDVYQWKRSKDVDYYLHMLHSCDGVLVYRMFGLDYYDGVLISGDFQERDLRSLEDLRGLPHKELCNIGIPFMDKMRERLYAADESKESENTTDDETLAKAKERQTDSGKTAAGTRTVLLAPSWGPSSILNKFGEEFITKLIDTGYHIIVRPHPQTFTSEKAMIEALMAKFPENDNFEWNRDNDNFEVLKRSDILISDFSSVTFDFALVYDKPIIYADTEFDRSPYDAWWLPDTPYFTFTALERIGMKLSKDNFDNIKSMIDEILANPIYAAGRDEVRSETWCHMGEGAVRAADFIEKKLAELKENGQETDKDKDGSADEQSAAPDGKKKPADRFKFGKAKKLNKKEVE